MIDHHNGTVAEDHVAFLGEIKGHDGDIFGMDIEPDVEFGPIGKGEHTNAFAFVETGVEKYSTTRAADFSGPTGPENRGKNRCALWRVIFPRRGGPAESRVEAAFSSASRRDFVFSSPQHFWCPVNKGLRQRLALPDFCER